MSRLHSPYDVVVVGARCAGAATALILAQGGLRVLLLDRSSPRRDTLSTHALMRTGVLLLDRYGVLDAVKRAHTPAVTRSTLDYGTHAAVVDIRSGHGVDALYAPRRHVLDPLLVDAAAAAGVDVALDVTVTDVERDDDGRVVGVVGRSRDATPFRARAPLTVGADGLASTVAGAVRAPVSQRGLHAGGIWYTYVTGLANRGYRMLFRPGAVLGLTPTNDGATCVFAGMPARDFVAPSRGDRWQALLERWVAVAPDAADELRAAECVAPVRGWHGHPSQRRRASGPGWALVGDAGYFKDPLGTHGMSQALRDAELLSHAVLDAAYDDRPMTQGLSSYEQRRDALSAGMFAATDALASYDWDGAEVERLLRQLSTEMSREVDTVAALTSTGSLRSRTA